MSKSNDPVRWLDDAQGLPDELAKSLPRYAQLGPSAELQARMFAAIEHDLTVSQTTGSGALDRGLRASSKLKLIVGGALVLMLAGGYALQRRHAPRETPASSVVAEVKAPVVVEGAAVVEAPAGVVVEAPPSALPAQLASVDAGVHELALAKGARHAPKMRARKPSEAPVLDPQAELSLLSRARRVLAGSPLRALALTSEHAEQFAHGMFEQEREVLAIEALVKLDRASEAQARASAFKRAHPRSTHLERIRVILSAQ